MESRHRDSRSLVSCMMLRRLGIAKEKNAVAGIAANEKKMAAMKERQLPRMVSHLPVI